MKNEYIDRIMPLERADWQNYLLPFHYVSHNYYNIEVIHSPAGFHVSFVKTQYDEPYEHLPDDTDKLFQTWRRGIKAWGIVDAGRLIAVIETAVEKWSNRLWVTEFWVDDAYRRQGIGTALMDTAMKRARDEKRRALILETQSRNENAIEFYLSYGFSLIGFDSCAYRNDDLVRKEVRMEMGILIEYGK